MSYLSKSIKALGKSSLVSKQIRMNGVSSAVVNTQLEKTTVLPFSSPSSQPPLPHRSFSSSNISQKENSSTNTSIMEKITSTLVNAKNRHSFTAQKNRVIHASCLFQAIKHQAHNPKWYNLPQNDTNDTNTTTNNTKLKPEFRQIHAMLSMHVWIIHRRLFTENKMLSDTDPRKNENLLLQEELFDLFWNDTSSRIRAQGVNELTVNKHLKDAQRATFLHCTQYDHAFEEFPNDVEKRFEVVCDAVWKHILAGEEDADDELIRRIGAYVEYQLENIVYKLPDDYFHEGRIAWGNIPDMSGGDANNESDNGSSDDDAKLSGPLTGMTFLDNDWVQVLSVAGHPYYWNTKTNKTTWERP